MQQRPPAATASETHAQLRAAGSVRAQHILQALVEHGLAAKPCYLWLASPYAAWCLSPYSHDLAPLVTRWAKLPTTQLPAAWQAMAPTAEINNDAHVATAALAMAQVNPQLWAESEHIGRTVGINSFHLGEQTGHIINLARLDLSAVAFGDCRSKTPLGGALVRIAGPPKTTNEAWELTTLAMLESLQDALGPLWCSFTIFAHASLPHPGTMKKSSWQPGPHTYLGAKLRRSLGDKTRDSTTGHPNCSWYDIDSRMPWQGEFAATRAAFTALLRLQDAI